MDSPDWGKDTILWALNKISEEIRFAIVGGYNDSSVVDNDILLDWSDALRQVANAIEDTKE